MLPSLCSLSVNEGQSVDANLFDFLSGPNQQAGKTKGCTYNSYDPDNDDTANNCAIDGYLMAKEVPNPNPKFVDVQGMFGKDLYVDMPDGRRTLHALLSRSTSTDKERFKHLKQRHGHYVHQLFDLRCTQTYVQRRDDNGNYMFYKNGAPMLRSKGIEFDVFGEELARTTDWYFVDEWITKEELMLRTAGRRQSINSVEAEKARELENKPSGRGHIFLRLYDTLEMKKTDKMPHEGVFAKPYLYIIVICAAGHKGFGSYMMKMAENVAHQCGCTTLALAALPDAAGFYYGKHGFRFKRHDGTNIELEGTPWHDERDGQVLLRPAEERGKRKREIEEEPREEGDVQPEGNEAAFVADENKEIKRPRFWQLLTSFFVL